MGCWSAEITGHAESTVQWRSGTNRRVYSRGHPWVPGAYPVRTPWVGDQTDPLLELRRTITSGSSCTRHSHFG